MAPKNFFLFFGFFLLNSTAIHAFNYLDYANLFDGIVHLNGLKIAGRESWSSDEQNWKAWQFLGLRYGLAERFQPPKFFDDYSSESHEHKMKTFSEPGPACEQSPLMDAHVFPKVNLNKTSEDCLFLNIHLPPVNQEQTLLRVPLWPVLIFIHGGDFQGGAGDNYDGNELARSIETVVVTLNYRLGVFGFLSTEDFTAKGNWGLKDVIMGVKWVQQNIGRFGADTLKIVLAGHGAGGALVSLAMMDQDVREILSGVIVMSGSALNPRFTIDSPRTSAVDLAKSAGCTVDSMQNLIDCLRNRNATQLLFLAESTKKTNGLNWVPTVDWDTIPFTPQWVLHSSSWKFNGSVLQGFSTRRSMGTLLPPLTTGFNFTNFSKLSTVDREKLYHFAFSKALSLLHVFVSETLRCNATEEAVDKVLRHYLKGEVIKNGPVEAAHVDTAVQRFLLDARSKLPIYQEAMEYAKNPALLGNAHTYQLYRLEYDEPPPLLSPDNVTDPKALELVDVAYLFGGHVSNLVLGPNHDFHITEQMRHLVGTFVKQGRTYGIPFHQQNGTLLHLGKSKRWEILREPSIPDDVHFWEELRGSACAVE